MSRGLVEQFVAEPSVFIQPTHFHQKDLSSGDERKAERSGNGAAGDHGTVLVEHGEPILLSVHAEYAPIRQNVGRKNRYLQRRAMRGTVGKIEKTYRRGTIVEIPKAIPVKIGNTGKAAVRHAPHFSERFVQNDKLSGGVAAADQSADGLGIDHFAYTLLGRKMPCAEHFSGLAVDLYYRRAVVGGPSEKRDDPVRGGMEGTNADLRIEAPPHRAVFSQTSDCGQNGQPELAASRPILFRQTAGEHHGIAAFCPPDNVPDMIGKRSQRLMRSGFCVVQKKKFRKRLT